MKKLAYLLTISLLLFQTKTSAQTWTVLGGSNWSQSNLGIMGNIIFSVCTDPSGNIYAAGDFSDDSNRVCVLKYNGISWGKLGSTNLPASGIPIATINDLCSDPSGNIYAGGNLFPASIGFVNKYNGTTWSQVGGADSLPANQELLCLYSDASGNIYAGGVFNDSLLGIYVAKWNGINWSELGGTSLEASEAIGGICSDTMGNIYAAISFEYVATYNGTSWGAVGGYYSLNPNGNILGMCIDASQNIYVAGEFTNSSGNYYVAKWNGTSWSELGGLNGLAANADIISICTDAADNIYAAGNFVNNSGNRYVAKYDGTAWSELGGLNTLAANSGISSICTDALGNIYAAGYFTNDSGVYVAKYGYPTGINETSRTSSIQIFPNPTNNISTISTGNNMSDANVILSDIKGQTLIEKKHQSGSKFTLDLHNQVSGIYFVEVNQEGNIWTGKLVKYD